MILYARPLTVGSLAAITALDECDVDFEVEWQEPGPLPEALAARHPVKSLPYLVPGDGALAGIGNPLVIMRYLERRFPEALQQPAPGRDAARARWIGDFAIEEAGPAAAEVFHGTVIAPAVGLEADQVRMQKAYDWIAAPQERLGNRSRFDILEEKAAAGWFNATAVGTAIIAVSSALAPLLLGDRDLEAWPVLSEAVRRFASRPSLKDQLDDIRELLG